MADRCKYQKLQYQVSYNNGSTWENVTPIQVKKGDVIEYMSRDCSEIETLYRWVDLEGTYICDGNNKYTRQIQEESYDNGVSWYASYPTVYQQGTFVGIDASYCCDKFIGHYTAPQYSLDSNCPIYYIWNGFQCIYIDPLKVVKCNGSNILTSDETRYYERDYELVSAEIGSSVTSIGDSAFYGKTSLIRVNSDTDGVANIPSGVTSIGVEAFFNCSGLTSITIPDTVINIESGAFRRCSGLTNVTIGSGITSIGDGAFYYCTSLTSCTIGSNVTSIGYDVFRYCGSLTSLTIEATTPPTLPAYALEYTNNCPIYVPCGSLNVYKTASGWRTYSTRIIGIPPCVQGAKFSASYSNGTSYSASCDYTTAVLTSGETRPNGYNYTQMLTAEIGDCVTAIEENAFYSFTNLTSCTIGSGVIAIGAQAFEKCRNLASVNIPNGVTLINDDTFYECSALTSVVIPDTVRSIGRWAFEYCSGLTTCIIGNGVTNIDSLAFAHCISLTSVTIPSGVTSIGQNAFNECRSLTSITCLAIVPPTIDSGVFYDTNNCPIYVPCYSVDAYKTAWSVWASRIQAMPTCEQTRWYPSGTTCVGVDKWEQSVLQVSYDNGSSWVNVTPTQTSATTLIEANSEDCGYVPPTTPRKFIANYSDSTTYSAVCDSNTELTTTTTKAHSTSCTAMINAVIGDCVTSIGYEAFWGCSGLTSVTIGSGVTYISNNAFYYCFDLTSIDIPNSVTGMGFSVFNECSSLTSVTIGSGVTSIGNSVFYGCTGLTNITIPDTVTSIGPYTFERCSGLTSVTIGSGVTSISDGTFKDCRNLTSVTCLATTPPTLSIYSVFQNTNNCPIYVPAASVNAYKAASGWSSYASRIQAIP